MKIAVIGYGGMGAFHTECLKQYAKTGSEPLTLAGIYDIDASREKAAEANGLYAYRSADELLSDKSVGAVIIATPNDVHAEYVKAAAEAGKHVVSEKPIGLSLRQAEEMYGYAEKAGIVFEVHQNRRWDDDFLTVKNIYDHAGYIGDVYRLESRVMGGNGIPGDWRKKAAQGGGMMLDWGVHLIDQMLQMVKSSVSSLYCEYSYIYGEEVEDGCRLSVKFENGVEYLVTVSTDCFRPLPRWQVYGTEGTATVAGWDLSGGMTRAIVRHDDNIAGIRAGNGFTRTMAPRIGDTVEEKVLPVVHAEPFAFYKNFAAACAGKEPAAIKKEEVLRVFRLMEAAARSAKENIVIKEKI